MSTFFGIWYDTLPIIADCGFNWILLGIVFEKHHLAIIADFVLFGHLNKIRDYVFNV